jgi:periodic tryptophan protein 2
LTIANICLQAICCSLSSPSHSLNNNNNPSSIASTDVHGSLLFVVGFNNGVFGLYELQQWLAANDGSHNGAQEGLNMLQTLSVSNVSVTSVQLSPQRAEWIAFASKLGQLLVWEWQSESCMISLSVL